MENYYKKTQQYITPTQADANWAINIVKKALEEGTKIQGFSSNMEKR